MVTPELRVIMVFLTSLISAIFLIPKLSRIATRIGLVDQPGVRKMHDRPLPLVGGIAMVVSATFSFLLFIPLTGLRGYFVGVAILLLVGFLDDYREIGHREKFLAQILATSILFYLSKVSLLSFGNLLGMGDLSLSDNVYLQWAVTVFCVVGVINAMNFIDGLDGLAGGISFIAFLTFAIHSSIVSNSTMMLLSLALLGAVAGFLRFNWKPAVVFMGDAGSLCLGFSLAFLSLALTQGESAEVRPVVALLILAVPIVDTVVVMIKRMVRKESPFKPDKYHLHHVFVQAGMSKEWSVKVICLICGFFCGLSILGAIYDIPDWMLFLVFLLYCSIYIVGSIWSIYLMRISRKAIERSKKKSAALPKIEKDDAGAGRAKFLHHFKNYKIYKFIRKSTRHDVDLVVDCIDTSDGRHFSGKVINISKGGVMLDLPQLSELIDNTILRLTFKTKDNKHVLELPAKHVWLKKKGATNQHGFHFLDFDGDQKDVIFRLLVRTKHTLND